MPPDRLRADARAHASPR